MGLLLSAAQVWESLLTTKYRFVIGRKKAAKYIELCFRAVDFDHLSGIHHADDIDFKLHRREFRGDKLISALKFGKIDDSKIEKSRNWTKIEGRLNAILRIEEILNSNFKIYEFSPRKLTFYSSITAEYLLFSEELKDGIFLFLDQTTETFYCKSIFEKGDSDYRANQTSWIILKKAKIRNGQETVLFKHPNFKETTGEIL